MLDLAVFECGGKTFCELGDSELIGVLTRYGTPVKKVRALFLPEQETHERMIEKLNESLKRKFQQ